MSAERWRYIPLTTQSGASHMAADTYLAQHPQEPVLRFYRWKPHAISLGHHQQTKALNLNTCDGIDVVRRPTGGRAIFHADELTYAVIIPKDSPVATGGIHDIHNRISVAIAAGLRRMGFEAELNTREPDLKEHYAKDAAAEACFSTSAKYELQIAGKKVVGSAQRKFQDAILQHGSILIGPTHRNLITYMRYTPEQQKEIADEFEDKTTELIQHSRDEVNIDDLSAAILDGFSESFQCSFNSKPLTDDEWQSIRHRQANYRILDHHASEEDNLRPR